MKELVGGILMGLAVGCGSDAVQDARTWQTRIEQGGKPVSVAVLEESGLRLDPEVSIDVSDLGPITVREGGRRTLPIVTHRGDRTHDGSRGDGLSLVVADAARERAFLVEMSEAAMQRRARIRSERPDRSALSNRPSDELEAALEDAAPLGWSNGVDNRVLRDVAHYGVDHGIYSQIGRFGHCTASFVEGDPPDHIFILTAAHCAWDEEGPNFARFWPRYDDGDKPYGTWRADWMVVLTSWIDNCADDDDGLLPLSCVSADIALVKVHAESGSTNEVDPDEQRFDYGTNVPLSTGTLYHRGYPSCGLANGPPANCGNPGANFLWGDGAATIGQQQDSGRRATISSDASGGHSGGPFYSSYGPDGWIFGVVSAGAETCYSGCNKSHPTYVRLIDGTWEGIMDYWTWDVWQ